jgi:lipid A 3-O-deacylase
MSMELSMQMGSVSRLQRHLIVFPIPRRCRLDLKTIWRLRFSVSPCLRGVLLFLGFMATSIFANAQTSKPLDGQPWDFGVWASGGFSVPGGTKDTHAINLGGRLGKVLTDDHFGGFLRGNFEWSADLIPVYYIWQPSPAQNAYAAAFNPLNLKWNFTSSARTVPYLELGGGVLFSNHAVPLNTSHVNFITHGTLGFQFFNNQRRAFTAGVRYEHISNAGLTVPNPGINTVQFQLGVNWFR